jgi:hypothetical protein
MLRQRSKNTATWLAMLCGFLGLHRFYLYGMRDHGAWLWWVPTLVGSYGLLRAWQLGQDDHWAWVLLPWLGLSIAAASLNALVYGLMPDEKWHSNFNSEVSPPYPSTGWVTIAAVVLALFMGATVLISTIAYSSQRFFEYQAEQTESATKIQR